MPVFSVDTANTLLSSVHDLFHDLGGLWGDSTHIQDLKLQEFLHAGSKVQGLAATKAIKTGESVFLEPPHITVDVPADDMKLPGFGHLKDEYEKLGFWLAQAKHDFVDHPPADLKLPRSDEIVVQYIRSLPSLTDLKKQGVPLAASYADLHKLDGLPHLGALSKSVDKQREALLDDWAEYTKARANANLPKIGYADALWGLTIARSQGVTFPHAASVHLLPVSDMLNYSDEGNVLISSVELSEKLPMNTTHMVHVEATKDVAPGTEMLLSYGNGQKTQGLDLLAKHGFFESAKIKDTWSIEDCAKINAALPHETLEKSKMLAAVDKLIQQSCPSVEKAAPAKAGAATDVVKSAAGGASVAVKPPTEQVVNPLCALVSPQGCSSPSSRDSRYSRFL